MQPTPFFLLSQNPMLAVKKQPIVAIATASGRGAVGIVRVSGHNLSAWMVQLLGRQLSPREATYMPFCTADGQIIDYGLALWFPAPHSYTAEDVLELQAHGGPVVLQMLLARCLETGSEMQLRLAEPGEFTQRAFLNGKLDLAQAEAVAGLIDATTEAAVRSAGRSLDGVFSREVAVLRDKIVHVRILIEATLDFPEEEINVLQQHDVLGQLQAIAQQLQIIAQQARQGALLREGMQVVIAGQPNAGKSSLLNALAGAELAIVTPLAGTTRDKLSQSIQIEGVPIHIIDTAGLRDDGETSLDTVEQIGIERAWQAIDQADAILFVHDIARQHDAVYIAADAEIAAKLPAGVVVLHVANKMDKLLPEVVHNIPKDWLPLSAETGLNLEDLRKKLLQLAGWQPAAEGVFMARARHLSALQQVSACVNQAIQYTQSTAPALDMVAEELRLAQNALNTITGEFTSDDLLGEIFSSFCIGK